MMQVPVRIAPSRIDGLGIFAIDYIRKGTVLWRFSASMDLKITGMCRASEGFQKYVEKYAFRPHDANHLVLCGDAAIFWNHSDAPNCSDPNEDVTVAARDIEPGEELTCDYRTFDSRAHSFLMAEAT